MYETKRLFSYFKEHISENILYQIKFYNKLITITILLFFLPYLYVCNSLIFM